MSIRKKDIDLRLYMCIRMCLRRKSSSANTKKSVVKNFLVRRKSNMQYQQFGQLQAVGNNALRISNAILHSFTIIHRYIYKFVFKYIQKFYAVFMFCDCIQPLVRVTGQKQLVQLVSCFEF